MVDVDEHGYVTTEVHGTPYTIKDDQRDTDADGAARRLASDDRVVGVDVEWDGSITIHVRDDNPHRGSEFQPDGFTLEESMAHPSRLGVAGAHYRFERK